MRRKTLRMVTLALLTAISIALCALIRFPIFPAAPYLEYEPADMPVMLASFLYGPWWGLGATVVMCALQALTVSAGSGVIGFFMHVFATGSFVIAAGLFYRRRPGPRRAALALTLGAALAVALMIPLNLIFTPLYGVPLEAVKSMIWPITVPFNLIKFGANAILTYVLYRPLKRYMFKD